MNEQALQDAFNLFTEEGYNGTFDDYKELIKTNEDAFNDSYGLFKNTGYNGSQNDFSSLIGLETAKTQDSAAADPIVESQNDMGSKSEEPLSAWQSIKNSFSNVFEQAGDVVEFWVDPSDEGKGARASLDVLTNAVAAGIFGQDKVDEYVKSIGEDSYWAQGLGSESTMSSIKKLEKEKEETKQTLGIIDSAKKGDIAGTFAGVVNAFTSVIGSGIYQFGTAGTGFFAEFGAQNFLEYNKLKAENAGITLKELVESGKADSAIPVGMGALSAGLEKIGLGKIARATKGATKAGGGLLGTGSKYIAEKVIYNKGARATMNMLSSGASEFTTEILQHAADQVNVELGSVAGTDKESEVFKTIIDAVTSQEGLEAGIQGFIGGGGMPAISYSAKAMNSIRSVVDGDEVTKNINTLADLRKKQLGANNKIVKEGIQKEINLVESKIADAVIKSNEIYESLTDDQISEIENLSDLANTAAFKITELNKEFRRGDISENDFQSAFNGFKKEYDSARQSIIDMELAKNLDSAQKITEDLGGDFEAMTTEEVEALMNSDQVSKKNRDDYFAEKEKGFTVSAFAIGNKIVIDKELARKTGSINAGMHEVLHPILNKIVGNAKEQGKMVRQFRKAMTVSQRRFVDSQMKKRGYTGKKYNTEYVNVFSDALRKKQINYDKTTFEKIGDAIVGVFKPLGYTNIGFDNGKDVYNFIEEFDKTTEQGKLTDKAKTALKGVDISDAGLEEELQASKSLSDEVSNTVKEQVLKIQDVAKEGREIAAKFGKEFMKSGKQERLEQKVLSAVQPVIEKIVTNRTKALYDPIAPDQKRNVSREDYQDSMRSDLQTMLINEYNGTQDVEKFLVNRGYLRANDLAKRLGIETTIKASLDAVDSEGRESIQVASDYNPETTMTEIRSEENRKKKLIDPRVILGPQRAKDYTAVIEDKIADLVSKDFEGMSFAKLKDMAPEVTADWWRTTVKKVITPAANLATKEIPHMQRLIIKHADMFISMLPEGAILEGETAREELIGTGVGVPRKLQQAFYNRGERTSKGAGLIPFNLKPEITKADFLATFAINPDETLIKINGRDPRSQAILALIRLYGQITTNTAVRELANLTGEQKADIRAGAASIQFNKGLRSSFELSSDQVDFNNRLQILQARKGLIKVFKELKKDGYSAGEISNIFIGTARGSWGVLGKKYIPSKDKLHQVIRDEEADSFRSKRFLMTGAADFFDLLKKAFPDVTYESGKSEVTQNNNKFNLDKVPSQSPKGFVDRSMFSGRSVSSSSIQQRHAYSTKQRNNLKILVDKLSDLHKDQVLTSNQTAMILATLGSSTNGLIRTAAKLVGYSTQGLEGKLTDDLLRFEHSQPASATIIELAKLINDESYPHTFDQIMDGFNVYIIPKIYDKAIGSVYTSKSPADENGNILLSDETNIVRYEDSETKKAISKAGLKPLKIQPIAQFSKEALNNDFNSIIEDATGIKAKKIVSEAKGKMLGRDKGRFKFFIPPSADDFAGLLYKLLGKGDKGNQQQAWFKENLFDPFSRGIRDFESYKENAALIVKNLKKSIKNIPTGLKKINETGFTNEDAVRVYLWAKQGLDIPGLTKEDQTELINVVNKSPKLVEFAKKLDLALGKYPEPQNDWLAGTITTDAINMINTTKRAEFLQEWQENVDEIFSKDNLNKLRAAFGDNYVEAMEDMLYRMKSGRNRPSGSNKLTNKFMNWVNDSVGTIMFFNTRSALLQTLSTVNFINWGDNNPIEAAKAFANQKQFWSDFAMLFNSDFLKQRRSGLKNDINADDIASAAETATNKAGAVKASLLKMGFLPTQMADSFAIALGGASFVRNRFKALKKADSSLTDDAAMEQALLDFQEIAEESQQSSRPDRISQQQASPLGRVVLAFANTPMQYMRLTKKAFLDLKNGRGDVKTNITKIAYYMAVQNIIFTALQSALFASLFEDDEEELNNKEIQMANSMLDSILRGVGVYGAIASTLKNIAIEVKKQSDKDRPDFTVAAQRALSISPPVDSKMRKLMSAGRAFSYKTTREKMKGFGLDNPAYYAAGQIVSATTNIPLDRAIRKADNIRVALDNDTKYWQSIALMLGYSQWDVGMVETSKDKKKKKSKFGSPTKWKSRKWGKKD